MGHARHETALYHSSRTPKVDQVMQHLIPRMFGLGPKCSIVVNLDSGEVNQAICVCGNF